MQGEWPQRSGKRRVLLVDNDPLFLSAAARSLRHRFLVASARSGASALNILRLQTIDVAIIDYKLGIDEPDGLTLLARIKASWPAVRCALYSAYAAVQLAVAAMKRGADHVAGKDEHVVDVIAALHGERARRPPPMSIETMERELMRCTLAECGGNKTRTADSLGITRQALYKKLGRWNSSED